jgi:hypothetical protein
MIATPYNRIQAGIVVIRALVSIFPWNKNHRAMRNKHIRVAIINHDSIFRFENRGTKTAAVRINTSRMIKLILFRMSAIVAVSSSPGNSGGLNHLLNTVNTLHLLLSNK